MRQIDVEAIKEALNRIEHLLRVCVICGNEFFPSNTQQVVCLRCQNRTKKKI